MNKRIIAGLMLNVLAAVFTTAAINAAPAYHHNAEKKEIIDSRHDFREHNRGAHHSRAELRKDKAQRNFYRTHGYNAAAAHKQHEIHKDKRHLRHERRDRRHDRHHGHHDRHDRRHHHDHGQHHG